MRLKKKDLTFLSPAGYIQGKVDLFFEFRCYRDAVIPRSYRHRQDRPVFPDRDLLVFRDVQRPVKCAFVRFYFLRPFVNHMCSHLRYMKGWIFRWSVTSCSISFLSKCGCSRASSCIPRRNWLLVLSSIYHNQYNYRRDHNPEREPEKTAQYHHFQ